MSQVISETAEAFDSQSVPAESADEFAYRPVPALAPISLFLGFCSLSGFLGIPCLAIGVVGMMTGVVALWQIRRSAGEFGGKLVAGLGVGISTLLLFAGSGYHAYAYVTELPDGYQRVSFSEMSTYVPTFADGHVTLAPEVAALEGKPIYIKGFMYPMNKKHDLTEFVLVKDTGQCCFGGQPKLTDMIVVRFENGMTVNHREQQLVGVGGIFRADVTQAAGLSSIYVLEGTHFK
ncbi:MAG: DUF3299 domain-containing protein [Planctomycetia bacterium]|nr:DUF3299 domain-containing protein [Planctomycetia bacterium]